MDWTIVVIAVAVLAGFHLLKRMSFVSEATARQHLAAGARVIDVRTPEEFRSDQVPNAINIPLGELRETIAARLPDKHRVLLVHCLSGSRSAIARRQLKGMGYANVHNLGSLRRARQIVDATSGEPPKS